MASTPKPAVNATKTATPAQRVEKATPDFTQCENIVTFIIGPAATTKKFLVHKEFACYYSPVLKAAFNSSFIEGQTQTYTIDDTTPGAFALLVQWLYTQNIKDEKLSIELAGAHWNALPRLWVLAEKLIMPRLQNQTIGAMERFRISSGIICTSEFAYVYENTTAGSELRRFLVDVCVWNLKKEVFPQAKFPEEMFRDLCTCFKNVVSAKVGAVTRKMADFHVKEDESSS